MKKKMFQLSRSYILNLVRKREAESWEIPLSSAKGKKIRGEWRDRQIQRDIEAMSCQTWKTLRKSLKQKNWSYFYGYKSTTETLRDLSGGHATV